MDRRSFLKLFGAGAAASAVASPVMRALADVPSSSDQCCIIVHAAGGWDVTIGTDPRNERVGIVDPATDAVVDTAGVRHWTGKPLGDGTQTFELITKSGHALGPALGGLIERFDRVTIINGIAMETVSHPDGVAYSTTGRHLAGGRAVQSTVDAIAASELGPDRLLPLVSVGYPSMFLGGPNLDARAVPLRMGAVTDAGASLLRSNARTFADDRSSVTALLSNEAADLAKAAYDPARADAMRLQYDALQRVLADSSLLALFDDPQIRAAQPAFFADASGTKIVRRYHDALALDCAFAIEAIKKRAVRCVSCRAFGFDMHGTTYQDSFRMFQEFFDVLATLVDRLDAEGLSDRVHILVTSDFCRTPQITTRGGRDHYPNNSAIVISSRFNGGMVFGESDHEQLLPKNVLSTSIGMRPVRPGDVLATFLSALGIDPRRHLRDGDVLHQVLR